MEFICNQEVFFKSINSVESVVKNKLSFSPHLSNLLLEVSPEKIIIKSTNGEMAQTTRLEGTIKQPGKISLPHARLSNLVRHVPPGNLSFSLNEENVLSIHPVNSKRQFSIEVLGIPADDFLSLPDFPKEGKSIILDKLYLKKMIQKVLFSSGAEPTRYALHAVLMEIRDQEIRLIATDTRRMAWFNAHLPDLEHPEDSVLLPQTLLAHLQKLLLFEGPLSLMIHKEQIFCKFDQYQISSSFVNGEFPKYEMFIPQDNRFSFIAKTEELVRAVELSSAVYEKSQIPRIIWTIKPGTLEIFAQEKSYNQAKETVPIDYQGEEIKTGFNVRMLLEILKQIETEKVEFYFNGLTSPFVIKEHQPRESTFIIMPVKLSD